MPEKTQFSFSSRVKDIDLGIEIFRYSKMNILIKCNSYLHWESRILYNRDTVPTNLVQEIRLMRA
jgi:hypothetical protein